MTRTPRVLSAFVALSLLFPALAHARQPQTERENIEAAKRAVLRSLFLPSTVDPTGSRTTSGPDTTASLTASSEGGRGEFKVSMSIPKELMLSIGLSAPLVDKATRFVLGDALPAGNKLVVDVTRVMPLRTSIDKGKVEALEKAGRAQGSKEFIRELQEAGGFRGMSVMLFGTGKFEYSRQTFEFHLNGAEATSKDFKESWNYVGQTGLLIKPQSLATPIFVGIGYHKSSSWSAASAKTRCSPISGSTIFDCQSIVVAGPNETKAEGTTLDIRMRSSMLGVMPLVSYNEKAEKGKRWSVDVPIYVGQKPVTDDGLATLTAGVVIGKKGGSGKYLAVFFGPSFEMPKTPPALGSVIAGLKAMANK